MSLCSGLTAHKAQNACCKTEKHSRCIGWHICWHFGRHSTASRPRRTLVCRSIHGQCPRRHSDKGSVMQLSAKYRSTVGRILVDYWWHISQLSYNLMGELGFSVTCEISRVWRFGNSFCTVVRVIPHQPRRVNWLDFCHSSTHVITFVLEYLSKAMPVLFITKCAHTWNYSLLLHVDS